MYLILTIPSEGIRIGTNSPAEVYSAITELLETGYALDAIEWE